MSNLVHVFLSEAGEDEAGPTEFAERVIHEEVDAERTFVEMEEACERFIESQVEIINSNESMREYNESMCGEDSDYGYSYSLYWLTFPNPEYELLSAEDWIARYLIDAAPNESQAESYVRQQVGHESKSSALTELAIRYG